MTLLARTWLAVRRWPVESQLRSRRNAMVASTEIRSRRAEAREVEDYLAAVRGPAAAPVRPVAAAEVDATGL